MGFEGFDGEVCSIGGDVGGLASTRGKTPNRDANERSQPTLTTAVNRQPGLSTGRILKCP